MAVGDLPAAVWGALIEFAGWICRLTPLENRLRRAGGTAEYAVLRLRSGRLLLALSGSRGAGPPPRRRCAPVVSETFEEAERAE
jgi:hypothetical protein